MVIDKSTIKFELPPSRHRSAGHQLNAPLEVFCDFDGTVADDSYDTVLEHLADKQWKVYEDLWQSGKIDGHQCLSRQIPLIRGTWNDIVQVLEKVKIDPYFKSFVEQCRRAAIPIYIGSGGLDKVIHHLLSREGIEVDGVWASRLSQLDNGTWTAEFPYAKSQEIDCLPAGACKCSLLDLAKNNKTRSVNTNRIVVGDGKSDHCWIRKADIVFAKSGLAKYCQEKDIDHIRFSSFLDIQRYLQEYIKPDTVLSETSRSRKMSISFA